ncbi:hypothetical protein COC42_14015 [Sphingomonas spermidinifaciens]|uniref:Uncharacterized protein n=1 Tax=Sphingomonas spermidinifaciens TaxID=1141889 RepID=A0A2A4B3J4_9SPHN|nr:hypothetical protein [Sphingomonas spermidinifaciens]PCD02525.1 hypothetical protein COC42_14015 [Sphingomonas spermidinifaciens]
MIRTLRLLLLIIVPAIAVGVPLGLMLGSYAKGESLRTYYAGNMLPEEGANLRSAASADAVQPAAVAYSRPDRYSDAAAHWIN